MKSKIKISAVLIFLALNLTGATAQEAKKHWTLDDCIFYALERNLSIKRQETTMAQSEVELNTAKNKRLPGLSTNLSENFSFGRGLTADNTYSNTNTTNTGMNIGAEMPLFQGFQIKHDIEAKKLAVEAAGADLEKIKNDIRVEIAKAYFQILYNKEILKVASNQVEIDSLQVLRLEAMALSGMASPVEVSQQKAAFAKSRLDKIQASNDLKLANLSLSQLLELPSPEGLETFTPDNEASGISLSESPESIYEAALEHRPEIEAERIRLKADSVNIKIAQSGLMPSLSLSGGIGTNYYTTSSYASSDFFSQMKNNFSQYVGLSLNIPIFQRFQNRNNIKRAELAYKNQNIHIELAKKSLYKEIQQAYYNAVASEAKYKSGIQAESSALESFELVKAKYENRKANITEFNEARNNYLKSAAELAQARYQHLYNSKLLDFYKDGRLSNN